MASKVALGIFWDIENCQVPLTKSASSVAKSLRDFVAAVHPECGYAKEFFCVCDTRKVDQRLLEGLDKNGVVVVHVNSTAKNAADDKLQELIDMYVDKYGTNGSAVLCIITGDINFAKPIRNARRKDLDVVLIHGISCSTDLKNLVNESYLYEDIIKTADNLAKDVNQLKPVYLEVLNLPTDQTLAGIIGRLSHLSGNCGGRPATISQGKGVIRFGCTDDAQRCLQRINGEDVFGHKIQVRLLDGEPKPVQQKAFVKQKSCDQTAAPIPAKLKNKVLSQQNLAKNLRKSQTDLTQIGKNGVNKDKSDECQSTIIGVPFKLGTDVKKLVKDMIISWNDNKLKPELIANVLGGKLTNVPGQGKVGDTLHVTAISAEANKALVFGSKKYLNGKGLKWYFKKQKEQNKGAGDQDKGKSPVTTPTKAPNLKAVFNDNDCKSVIKGLETKKEDNVAKIVRKMVESWSDKSIQPNYIKTVERDKKYVDKDGMVLLFVTTHSPEQCNALLAAVDTILKPTDPIKWTPYRRKRNFSKDTDNDSNVSDFEFIPSKNSSTQDLRSPVVKKAKDAVVTDEFFSVITGLETKKGENVAKVVRKIVFKYKNPRLNGNMIKDVIRFPDFPDVDGKVPLMVTAVSADACVALVAGAEMYIPPSRGILWAHFKSDSVVAKDPSDKPAPKVPVAPNLPNHLNGLLPKAEVKPQPTVVKSDGVGPTPLPRTMSPVNDYVPKPLRLFSDFPLMPSQGFQSPIFVNSFPDTPVSKPTASFGTGISGSTPLSSPTQPSYPHPEASSGPGLRGPTPRPPPPQSIYPHQSSGFGPGLRGPTSQPPSTQSIYPHPSSGFGSGLSGPTPPSSPMKSAYVPVQLRKDGTEKNLIQSLVSGIESLFGKAGKSSSSKSLVTISESKKSVDPDLISDAFLSSLTPIYYPETTFRQFFNDGMRDGFTLFISGRLKAGADCFAINFIANTDIAFHFNVRYRQSLVVRNSQMNGLWGPEERVIPNFPFVIGQPFDVIIRIKRDRYVVAVNRQHFCDFEHRLPITSLGKVSVTGDISINCLRYT